MALYRGSTKLAGIGAGFVPENSGTTGQVLTKTSTGYNYQDAPSGLPEGGTVGQVVTKTASGAEWADPAASGIQNDTVGTTTAADYIWVGSEDEFSSVTKAEGKIYMRYE